MCIRDRYEVDPETGNKLGETKVNIFLTGSDGKLYYVDEDGSYHKGWLTLSDGKRYCDPKTGEVALGYYRNLKDEEGKVGDYFFSRAAGYNGQMVAGRWTSPTEYGTFYCGEDGKIVKENFVQDDVLYEVDPETGNKRCV